MISGDDVQMPIRMELEISTKTIMICQGRWFCFSKCQLQISQESLLSSFNELEEYRREPKLYEILNVLNPRQARANFESAREIFITADSRLEFEQRITSSVSCLTIGSQGNPCNGVLGTIGCVDTNQPNGSSGRVTVIHDFSQRLSSFEFMVESEKEFN